MSEQQTSKKLFRITQTRCGCHPETCCCPDFTVLCGDEVVCGGSDRESMQALVDAANRATVEPSTDQSDIDFLAATLVDQESVLDECEKLLKESLAEDGVECGFDRRLEQYWQKRKALADWRSRELRLAEPPTSRLLLVPCPRCFGTGKLKPYKREGDTDWRIDDCPEKHVTAQPPTSAQSSGHEPYWTRSFWSPCREYLLSVHSYGEREIVAIDDNGDEWEATGPAQDIAGDAVSLLRQSSTKEESYGS